MHQSRWLPPRGYRPLVKQASLIAPAIPTALRLTRKQFEIWPGYKSLDPLTDAVGLSAVLTAFLDHKPPHVLCKAWWFAACCQQALLGIGPCPIAEPSEEICAMFAIADLRRASHPPLKRNQSYARNHTPIASQNDFFSSLLEKTTT
jgi:hypothetical protein